jgi:hypothetical protein
MQLQAGIQVSIDNTNWYKLTDHNRQPIKIGYEVIEKTNRMADGTLRRYVVARKHKISSSWNMVPSLTENAVDYKAADTKSGKAGAWMKSFYEANVFVPIYVKLINAGLTTQNINTTDGFTPDENTYYSSFQAPTDTDNVVYTAYITAFDYEVVKRNAGGNGKGYDLVNITIEFTEV